MLVDRLFLEVLRVAVRRIIDMDLDGVDYQDPCVEFLDEYQGLKIGDEFSKGNIVQICIHPESRCAWIVISGKGCTYEVDIPYEG